MLPSLGFAARSPNLPGGLNHVRALVSHHLDVDVDNYNEGWIGAQLMA
jgi:hypothetical protein